MQLPDTDTLIKFALILLGVAIGWTLLRGVLKLTARLFKIGCLVLVVVVAGIWLVSWLGH
jgi:uncharacterized membrane protein AbrB (regulator of aidB expression)